MQWICFCKKLTWRFPSLRKSSRHLQNSTKVNPPPQFKLFSYLLPTSLSNPQPLGFIRSTAKLIPHLPLQLPLMLLSPWATKIFNQTTPARTSLPAGKLLIFCLERSQASSEQQIHQEPKLTSSIVCAQLADNMLYKVWRMPSVFKGKHWLQKVALPIGQNTKAKQYSQLSLHIMHNYRSTFRFERCIFPPPSKYCEVVHKNTMVFYPWVTFQTSNRHQVLLKIKIILKFFLALISFGENALKNRGLGMGHISVHVFWVSLPPSPWTFTSLQTFMPVEN